jgi:vesicular inhibitory amino acid transporter
MAQEKPRKEEKEEEEELMLEDGGIEESPRRSFEDCGDSEEDRGEDDDDDDEERDRDGDAVGSPRSFQSQKWPQSYRCVRCCHSLLDRRLRTRLFYYYSVD